MGYLDPKVTDYGTMMSKDDFLVLHTDYRSGMFNLIKTLWQGECMNENREVIKASAAVHIENVITLLQRRAWTVLLANAYDELPFKEKHTITIRELSDMLEFDSHNIGFLKEALRALVKCEVQWNVLDKDQEWEWGTTTLLAGARIKKGILTYTYDPILRERLHNPRLYARISLSLQNKFVSKHALALWEICLDCLDHRKNYGETPYISLAKFRQLMGIPEDGYPDFKILNRNVIKESIGEINTKTDFKISVEYKRKKRKVEEVKYRFRRILSIGAEQTKQCTLFSNDGDIPQIVKELCNVGFAVHIAWEIWQKGFDQVDVDKRPYGVEFEDYVHEKILLLKQQRAGQVRSPTGFVRDAIQKNYSSKILRTPRRTKPTFMPEEKTYDRAEEIHARCWNLVKVQPKLLDGYLDKSSLHEAQPFLYKQYMKILNEHDLLSTYENHPALAAYVDGQIVAAHPEYFEDLNSERTEESALAR